MLISMSLWFVWYSGKSLWTCNGNNTIETPKFKFIVAENSLSENLDPGEIKNARLGKVVQLPKNRILDLRRCIARSCYYRCICGMEPDMSENFACSDITFSC